MAFYTTHPFIDPFYITVNAPPSAPRPRSPTKSPHHRRTQSHSKAGAVSPSQVQQPSNAAPTTASLVASQQQQQQQPQSRKFTPPTDFYETDTGYGVEISLPGVRKEQIEVEFVSDRRIVVRGRKDTIHKDELEKEGGEPALKKRKYWVNERVVGEFARNIEFPSDIDVDSVGVKLDNGILTIQARKEVKKPRGKIEIEYFG